MVLLEQTARSQICKDSIVHAGTLGCRFKAFQGSASLSESREFRQRYVGGAGGFPKGVREREWNYN